ncbi:MAG: DUF6019 family protein [Eubacteriales bacterium]|nr:DUF6019 family protein [Eubacteriales bacterium]
MDLLNGLIILFIAGLVLYFIIYDAVKNGIISAHKYIRESEQKNSKPKDTQSEQKRNGKIYDEKI